MGEDLGEDGGKKLPPNKKRRPAVEEANRCAPENPGPYLGKGKGTCLANELAWKFGDRDEDGGRRKILGNRGDRTYA
jgi:hypothetical protein